MSRGSAGWALFGGLVMLFFVCGCSATVFYTLEHVFSSAPSDVTFDNDEAEIVTFNPGSKW